jgi:hypothetical protein
MAGITAISSSSAYNRQPAHGQSDDELFHIGIKRAQYQLRYAVERRGGKKRAHAQKQCPRDFCKTDPHQSECVLAAVLFYEPSRRQI